MESFVFDDFVAILHRHLEDFYEAKAKENTSYGGDLPFTELFLSLQPHFALRSNPNEEHYLRILMDLFTRILMPSYEYNCDAIKYLLRGVLVQQIKTLIDQWSEPAFIFQLFIDVTLC